MPDRVVAFKTDSRFQPSGTKFGYRDVITGRNELRPDSLGRAPHFPGLAMGRRAV
jgi:hypothetical protein